MFPYKLTLNIMVFMLNVDLGGLKQFDMIILLRPTHISINYVIELIFQPNTEYEVDHCFMHLHAIYEMQHGFSVTKSINSSAQYLYHLSFI